MKKIPNYLTIFRIIVSFICIGLIIFPFEMVNVDFPKYLINGTVILDLKLVICAVLFVIASITDFLDGYIARKYNAVTDFGKVMDAIADKILINGVIISLCGKGYINVIIPVLLVTRDTIVNTIKMVAGKETGAVGAIKTGKFKTAFLMIGVALKLISNLPMGLLNIRLDDFFLVTACILSLVSMVEYIIIYKKYFTIK